MTTADRPLVSFCVPFYRQERFVADALRGLFAQTYPNVEFVICDDCSPDGTFAAAEREVAAYRARGGEAPVTLVRNERNLGIVKNWERAFSLARGELLVSCGGDDISRPDRAEEIVRAWEAGGRTAGVIIHGFDRIDLEGRPSDSNEHDWRISAAHPLGAVIAYSRKVVDLFEPIRDPEGVEDYIFARRGLLVGEELRIDKPLVAYRVGSGASTCEVRPAVQRLKSIGRALHSTPQTYRDLEQLRDTADPNRYDTVKAIADEAARRYPAERNYLLATGFFAKFRAYRAYRRAWNLPNHLSSVIDYVRDYARGDNRLDVTDAP